MEKAQFHPIQEQILKRLGYETEEKSFSDIRGDIESNKFAFHLKKLQEKQMIEKTEDGYRLTRHGREILPYFDLKESYHPVIVVDLILFSGDSVYLAPKETDPLDPFAGDFRAPSSRISKNERLKEQANLLFEKEFGYATDDLEASAVFDSQVTFMDGSQQHYLVFYFEAEIEKEDSHKWFKLDELGEINLLPGLERAAQKMREADGMIMGTWDIVETESGFEVDTLEFQPSP